MGSAVRPQTLAEWAAWYASNGFAVFPLNPKDKNPHALHAPHGFKDASTDIAVVSSWWDASPSDNIGIATGDVSGGLLVIDCDVDADRDEDGLRTLHDWESVHGELPETVTVITGRGGQHLLYRTTEPIGCSQDRTEDKHIGIDIRANGGYIVAPPSVHPNGRTYELEDYLEDVPVADADDNVLEFVRWVQEKSKKGAEDGGANGGESGDGGGFNIPDAIHEGERDRYLFELAYYLHRNGVSKRNARVLVNLVNEDRCVPPMPESVVNKKVDSAYGYQIGTINKCVAAIEDDDRLHWKDGDVWRCSFAWNSFAQRRYVTGPLPWDESGIERAWTPDDDLLALAHAQTLCKGGKDAIAAAFNIVATKVAYDPVKDLLLGGKGLPAWDGVPRVGTMLIDLLGCEDTTYVRVAWQTFMSGAFMRAVQPGIKFDLMALLYGPQGCGKTTFTRLCAIYDDWYLDGPKNLTDVSNAAREMSGKLICEQSELAGMRKADIEPIKAAITRTHDEYVDKWQVTPTVRPRRCCFIGTTNDRQVLRDQTGNRRFLVFECGVNRPRVSVFSDEGREYVLQAWAELAAHYREGGCKAFRVYLQPDIEREADIVRERFAELDEVAESIQSWIAEYTGNTVCGVQVAEEALHIARDRYSSDKQLQRRVTSALDNKCAGWLRADRKMYVPGWGTRVAWVRGGDAVGHD